MWYRPYSSWLRRGGPRPAGATRNESSALLCVTGTVTALSGDTRPPVERVTRPPDAGKSDGTAPSVGIPKVGTSDGELVRRVLAGDTGAYAALVARYRDRLGRYAVHMLGDRQDAEEALQDAFVRAHRSLARCDDPERFGAWLYGILVNRCRTTGGRAARRARLFVRDDAALSGVPLPNPAAAARRLSPRRSGDGSGARGPRLGTARPGSTPSASGSHVPAVSVRRGRAARDPRGARRRFQRLGRHAHPDATVPARRFRLDRGVAAVARALSLRLPRRRLPLARRSRGAARARRRVRRAELGRHRGWLVMPRSLAAAGALAALLAATAVAQDPRLGRLDATARPLVAGVIDSARAAGLPTEPLVQRALEGATKGAPGTLIASAVQRLAADLGRARAVLGAGATPPELEAGAAAPRAGAGPAVLAQRRPAPRQNIPFPLPGPADPVASGLPVGRADAPQPRP